MRRLIEERRELPSGTLDLNDYDPHLAAVELFYLERDALAGVLQNLFIGAMQVGDDHKRGELRQLIYEHLLADDVASSTPPLTSAIPDVLIYLTDEIQKLKGQCTTVLSGYACVFLTPLSTAP